MTGLTKTALIVGEGDRIPIAPDGALFNAVDASKILNGARYCGNFFHANQQLFCLHFESQKLPHPTLLVDVVDRVIS
jgi:hypothetical protein